MKIGDKVQWAVCKTTKKSMQFKELEGVILKIKDDQALVIKANNHRQWLQLNRLLLIDTDGHLTRFVKCCKGRSYESEKIK